MYYIRCQNGEFFRQVLARDNKAVETVPAIGAAQRFDSYAIAFEQAKRVRALGIACDVVNRFGEALDAAPRPGRPGPDAVTLSGIEAKRSPDGRWFVKLLDIDRWGNSLTVWASEPAGIVEQILGSNDPRIVRWRENNIAPEQPPMESAEPAKPAPGFYVQRMPGREVVSGPIADRGRALASAYGLNGGKIDGDYRVVDERGVEQK